MRHMDGKDEPRTERQDPEERASAGGRRDTAGKRRRRRRVLRIAIRVCAISCAIAILAMSAIIVWIGSYVRQSASLLDKLDLDSLSLNQATVLYYQDRDTGEWLEMTRLHGAENRTMVPYTSFPSGLVDACVAIEDKRFYSHQGVDWLRTAKAAVNKIFRNSNAFGASTITQQLIKNLTGKDEVQISRKLNEIAMALALEQNYSKQEIITWYLNTVCFGEGCFGVQSAAQMYFGKNVEDLTVAECASIVGITRNPSAYDPYLNKDRNIERQRLILSEMHEQGMLDDVAYDEAVSQELSFRYDTDDDAGDGGSDSGPAYYSYFTDEVVRAIISDFEAEGYTREFAERTLYYGGLSIYTTFDPKAQAAVDEVYSDVDGMFTGADGTRVQSAIVVIDNSTGDIAAIAGGTGPKEGSLTFDRATQSRLQPASSLKPLTVYAPALSEKIITPASTYEDSPTGIADGNPWPSNIDLTYRGTMTVDEAVRLSTNTVPVRILNELGMDKAVAYANDGFHVGLDEEDILGTGEGGNRGGGTAQLALGGLNNGVTVKAMAGAYAALANGGTYRTPRFYTKACVYTDGKETVVLDNAQESNEAVSERAAAYMTEMLGDAALYGTGKWSVFDEGIAVAGKTGTSDGEKDKWFCGYTPYYTAAVWCGHDMPAPVEMADPDTGNIAIKAWRAVMSIVHEGLPQAVFGMPDDFVQASFCMDSGLSVSDGCVSDPRGDRTVSIMMYGTDVPVGVCSTYPHGSQVAEADPVE